MTNELKISKAKVLSLAEKYPQWRDGLVSLFPEAFEAGPTLRDERDSPVADNNVYVGDIENYNSSIGFWCWIQEGGRLYVNMCPKSERSTEKYRYGTCPALHLHKDHARDMAKTIMEIIGREEDEK